MAYYRKRGSKWSFTMDVGRDPITGKRKQITRSGFKTKKEAQLEVARITQEIENNEYENQNIRFKDLVNLWLEEKEMNVRPSTLYAYNKSLRSRIMPVFENKIVSNIKPLDIHNFYQKLIKDGLSTNYVSYIDTILKSILDKAVSFEIINSNPARKVKPPKVVKEKQDSWTIEEASYFLREAKLRAKHYIVFYLALQTGMRIGEILGLKWTDIDYDRKSIHVQRTVTVTDDGKLKLGEQTKTSSSNRIIPINDEIIQELEEQKFRVPKNNPLDLVVCTSRGKIIHPYSIRYTLKNICEQIGLEPIRFHDLRRTHSSILMQLGVNPKVVSDRLGHSTVAMTFNVYTDVYAEQQKEATDKLSNVLKSGQNVVSDHNQNK